MKRTEEQIKYAAELGDRLRAALGRAELSQYELARRMGVTRAAVNQWIQNGRIHATNLMKFAEITGCDIEWLLSGKGSMRPGESWLDLIETLEPEDQARVKDYIEMVTAAVKARYSEPEDE